MAKYSRKMNMENIPTAALTAIPEAEKIIRLLNVKLGDWTLKFC